MAPRPNRVPSGFQVGSPRTENPKSLPPNHRYRDNPHRRIVRFVRQNRHDRTCEVTHTLPRLPFSRGRDEKVLGRASGGGGLRPHFDAWFPYPRSPELGISRPRDGEVPGRPSTVRAIFSPLIAPRNSLSSTRLSGQEGPMLGSELGLSDYLSRCAAEFSRLDLSETEQLSEDIYQAYRAGRMVFICGNGGSGSNASHFCEDLGKSTLRREDFTNDAAKRLKVLSLTDNTPYILAWANDEGFDRVFVEQLKNFASRGTC